MRAFPRFRLPILVIATIGAMVGGVLTAHGAPRANPSFRLVQITKSECALPRKIFGKACVDESGMVIRDAWSLSETKATWEPSGWRTTYQWDVPDVVGPTGAPIQFGLTAESKQPGRICPAMGARSGLPLRKAGETTDLGICAEQGKGTTSGSKTLSVLAPSGGPVYVLIGLQDGPSYTYKYVADAAVAVPASLSIKQIQNALRFMGVYNGPLDGRTSLQLTVAIKDFQHSVGIPADGRCGTDCRKALAEARALDDPAVGPDEAPVTKRTVTELQRDLKFLGFFAGPLDGRTGPTLTTAVKDFQQSVGIRMDGKCDSDCQLAIVRALNH